MYIDTHAHLYLEQFDEDRNEVIQSARDQGIDKIFMPNVDLSTIEAMHEVARDYPSVCFPMMGLHPCSVGADYEQVLERILTELKDGTYCAIGEIGLDFYWDKTWVDQQENAFCKQVEWAIERKLPIAIHSREAMDRLLELLEPYRGSGLRGVFHCFTGTLEQGLAAIDLGFMLGIGGVLTFKNSNLAQTLPEIGLEHLILETDSPYLAPVPHRGKRNESSYIPVIAHRLAEILQVSLQEVEEETTGNACRLFQIEC